MGLDVVLGVIILLWAVRGWFKGFARQAIGLGALVAAVYLAAPIRDVARPYVSNYLPSLRADVIDRLIWWTSAVLAAVVLSGLGGWMLRWKKKPANPYAPSEPNRADQGAGFLLGALKGSIAVSFLAAAFNQYVPKELEANSIVEEQRKASRALVWSKEYQPADKLWKSQPAQAFVGEVRRNGLWEEAVEAGPAREADEGSSTANAPLETPKATSPEAGGESVRTARRTPALEVPGDRRLEPGSKTFLDDVDAELRRLGLPAAKSR